jgi:hypothetical protein
VIDGVTTAPAHADNLYSGSRIVVFTQVDHGFTSAACAQIRALPIKIRDKILDLPLN